VEDPIGIFLFLIFVIFWKNWDFRKESKVIIIYHHDSIVEIINIQPVGFEAKAYQVKQVRNIILKYKLEE